MTKSEFSLLIGPVAKLVSCLSVLDGLPRIQVQNSLETAAFSGPCHFLDVKQSEHCKKDQPK